MACSRAGLQHRALFQQTIGMIHSSKLVHVWINMIIQDY